MHIDHINIKAPRALLDQEKRFFCDILCLQEGPRPDFASMGYWLYAGDQAIVHLSESQQHYRNEQQGFLDHVAFHTTGLQRLLQRLENAGIDYSTDYLADYNTTQVFFRSPSDTGIEVAFIDETL